VTHVPSRTPPLAPIPLAGEEEEEEEEAVLVVVMPSRLDEVLSLQGQLPQGLPAPSTLLFLQSLVEEVFSPTKEDRGHSHAPLDCRPHC
jgi:hypothetical protein